MPRPWPTLALVLQRLCVAMLVMSSACFPGRDAGTGTVQDATASSDGQLEDGVGDDVTATTPTEEPDTVVVDDSALADSVEPVDSAVTDTAAGCADCTHFDGPCSDGICREGACFREPKVAATCDDGKACNGVAFCDEAGVCQPGEPMVCADDVACTTMRCEEGVGCVTDVEGCGCEMDGDCQNETLCDGVEVCGADFQCKSGERVVCEDTDDACTHEVCEATTGVCGITDQPDTTACDDGDACTEHDQCGSGSCEGVETDCSDGLACTKDSCSEADGSCTHDAEACECTTDDDCQNGKLCDGRETCDASGQCQAGVAVICAATGNVCTRSTCVEETGLCEAGDQPDGRPCDDEDACTTEDACDAGECVGGPPPDDSVGDWTIVGESPNGMFVVDAVASGVGDTFYVLLDHHDSITLGPTVSGGTMSLSLDTDTWARALSIAEYSMTGKLLRLKRIGVSDTISFDSWRLTPATPSGVYILGDVGRPFSFDDAPDVQIAGPAPATAAFLNAELEYMWHRTMTGLPVGQRFRGTVGPDGIARFVLGHGWSSLRIEGFPQAPDVVVPVAGASMVGFSSLGQLVSATPFANGPVAAVRGAAGIRSDGNYVASALITETWQLGPDGSGGNATVRNAPDSAVVMFGADGEPKWSVSAGSATSEGVGWCWASSGDETICVGVTGSADASVWTLDDTLTTLPRHSATRASSAFVFSVDTDGAIVWSNSLDAAVKVRIHAHASGAAGTSLLGWREGALTPALMAGDAIDGEYFVTYLSEVGDFTATNEIGVGEGLALTHILAVPSTEAVLIVGTAYGVYALGATEEASVTQKRQPVIRRFNSAGGLYCL